MIEPVMAQVVLTVFELRSACYPKTVTPEIMTVAAERIGTDADVLRLHGERWRNGKGPFFAALAMLVKAQERAWGVDK